MHRVIISPKLMAIVATIALACCACRQKEHPRFERLTAAQTGVRFANTIAESDSLSVLNFEYLYNGAGVGVGDFNRDGLPDLFFAGNQVSSALYLNRGNFAFIDITAQSGIHTPHWSTGVAIADVNADGWPDIYLSTIHPDRHKSAPNQLFIHQGLREGIPYFKETAALCGVADTGYCTQAAFLDYDLDGDLDMYLLRNALEEYNRNEARPKITDGSARSNDQLYRNDGPAPDGLPRFTNVSHSAGIRIEGWGLGIGVSDVNFDGWPDIYCANDFLSNDLLWINQRDGTFQNRIDEYLRHQSHNSMGVDIADISNDGYPEIVTLDMMPDDNRRQKSMFPAPNHNKYTLDINLGYQPQFVRNMLQWRLPGAGFVETGQMAGVYATDWSWSALFADLDLDGWRDLWITNGYKKDVTDLDFASFQRDRNMFGTDQARRDRFMGQINDLIGVKKSNFVFRNTGSAAEGVSPALFEDVTNAWGLQVPSYSNGAAYVDLDQDGDLDMAVNNLDDPAFIVKNNTLEMAPPGQKPHFLKINLRGKGNNTQALGAKVTIWYGNGQSQYAEQYFVRGYKSSVEPLLYFGLGSNTTVDSITVIWPGGQRSAVYNTPADQTLTMEESAATAAPLPQIAPKPALFSPLDNPGYTHIENDFTDFNLQSLMPRQYSNSGPALATGDVNGDGLDDCFVGSSSSSSGALFVQTRSGQFVRRDFPKADLRIEETACVFFDADADTDLDLYVVSGGFEHPPGSLLYQDQLYLNDGQGRFAAAPAGVVPAETASGGCVAAADYNGDGRVDLFVGGRVAPRSYPMPPRSFLWKNITTNNTPAFAEATPPDLQQPGMIADAQFADFDGDAQPDLALAGEFMPVSFFSNEKGQFKAAKPPSATPQSGWWNCLTAADFDRDGDLDLVAGNLGLNSRFQASAAEPVSLYAKDYDQNGSIDPVLCRFVQGLEYPTHARDALTGQIPGLKKRFLLYADYGKKTIGEVFTAEERSGALTLKSDLMASVYWENRGNFQFIAHPLPLMAQLGPVQCAVAADYDGDGHLDLCVVGNDYGAEVQTGRYDALGAVVLRGNGKGHFQALSPAESGVWLSADTRKAVVLNTAAGHQLWIGVNRGAIRRFDYSAHTSPVVGRPSVRKRR